jgi:hypothetical protein
MKMRAIDISCLLFSCSPLRFQYLQMKGVYMIAFDAVIKFPREVAMKTGLALDAGAWIILFSGNPRCTRCMCIPIYVQSRLPSIYRFLSAAGHNLHAP